MKALSIRQPWAWAILNASKRIENRSRRDGKMPPMCAYRGPLLIHASVGMKRDEYDVAASTMNGQALANLLDGDGFFSAVSHAGIVTLPRPERLTRGGIVGVCNVVAHIDPAGVVSGSAGGPVDRRWHVAGSYGLVLADVRPLPFRAFKGSLGLFEVPDRVVTDLELAALRVRP